MRHQEKTELIEGSFLEILKYKCIDRIVAYAFIIYMCSDFMRSILNYLIPAFAGKARLISGTMNIILFSLIIAASVGILQRNKLRVWPIYLFVFGTIFLSFILHPEYRDWFQHREYGVDLTIFPLSSGIWMLLLVGLFSDKKKLLNCLLFSAKPLFIYYILLFVRFWMRGYWVTIDYQGNEIRNSYNLDFGYNIAFCCVVFIYLFLKSKKISYIYALSVGVIIMLMGGSRGAVVGVTLFIALFFVQRWRTMQNRTKKMEIVFGVVFGALATINIGSEKMQEIIVSIATRMNISGRLIEMILSGDILSDSGRNRIWKIAIEIIKENGIRGAGFYGDRYIIGRSYYWGYCHNIFLELWIDYGTVMGTALIIILAVSILRMFIKNQDDEWTVLLIIFLSCCVKLYFSNSFWYHKFFWGLLGVLGLWMKQNSVTFKLFVNKSR